MVAKKKGLYFGLLLSLLGMGNLMQAGRLSIRNGTPYRVKVAIRYYDKENCPKDKVELGPYGRRGQFSELCNVKSVKISVYYREKSKKTEKVKLKTEIYKVPLGEEEVILLIKEVARGNFKIVEDEEFLPAEMAEEEESLPAEMA